MILPFGALLAAIALAPLVCANWWARHYPKVALGLGAGGESRQPLGLAVVGGLLFSQTLTLYVTPVFFLYMERFRTWVAGLIGAGTGKEAGESAPASPGEGDGTTHT